MTIAVKDAIGNTVTVATNDEVIAAAKAAPAFTDRSFTTVAGVSQLLIGPDPERTELTVFNNTTADIALSVAPRVVASVTDAGAIKVAAGAAYVFKTAPRGDVYVYATAAGNLTVFASSASLADGQYSKRCFAAAARLGMPTAVGTGNLSITSRCRFYARSDSDVGDLSLVFPGWYYTVSATAPTAIPNNVTVTASIEYPTGILNQVTFGGNVSAVLTPGSNLISDAVRALRIPMGAKFYIRTCYTVASNTTPLPVQQIQNDGANLSSIFDSTNSSATASADFTMTPGTFNADGIGGGSQFVAPSAILGTALTAGVNPVSVLIWADSITYGQGETTQSALGAQGWTPRVLDTIGVPYIKIGRPGAATDSILQSATLFNYLPDLLSKLSFSHTLMQMATNNINVGTPVNQLLINLGKIWNLTPGKKVTTATLLPRTNSTDSFATSGNQTPQGGTAVGAAAILYNQTIRGFVYKNIDAATAVSPSLDANVWTGVTPPLVRDGTHPLTLGVTTIATDASVLAQARAAFA